MKTAIAIAFTMFAIMITGCETPESFHDRACEVKPGANFLYACEDGTYRCDDALGKTKYVDCQLDTVYCVETCR